MSGDDTQGRLAGPKAYFQFSFLTHTAHQCTILLTFLPVTLNLAVDIILLSCHTDHSKDACRQ